jgi:hypothetical protein
MAFVARQLVSRVSVDHGRAKTCGTRDLKVSRLSRVPPGGHLGNGNGNGCDGCNGQRPRCLVDKTAEHGDGRACTSAEWASMRHVARFVILYNHLDSGRLPDALPDGVRPDGTTSLQGVLNKPPGYYITTPFSCVSTRSTQVKAQGDVIKKKGCSKIRTRVKMNLRGLTKRCLRKASLFPCMLKISVHQPSEITAISKISNSTKLARPRPAALDTVVLIKLLQREFVPAMG